MPAAFAVFSLSPVVATVMSNTLITDEPWEPLYSLGIPQMLSAAILPCLFAGPASEMTASVPETNSLTCTASPTA